MMSDSSDSTPLTPWPIVLLLTAFFAAVVFTTLMNHELWKDEAQAWLMATQSRSIGELLHAVRYEGHPAIWYLFLDGVAMISTQAVALQIAHGLIATLSVLILLRFSPFALWQKVLLIFSYFLAYEYAVISRGYSLGVLGLFVLAAIIGTRRRTLIPIALMLAFLINVSLLSLMLSAAIGVGLAVDWLLSRGRRPSRANAMAAILICLAATATAAATVYPPLDSVYRVKPGRRLATPGTVDTHLDNLGDTDRIGRSITSVWRSYVPIPWPHPDGPWNSNVVFDQGAVGRRVAVALSVGLLGVALLTQLRRPVPLLIYAAGTGIILLFFIVRLAGNPRHNGHLFLLLVFCWWIAREFHALPDGQGLLSRAARWGDRLRTPFIVVILVVQVMAAVGLIVADLRGPFSGSKGAAAMLRERGLVDAVIIANPAHRVSGLSAYLDKSMYQPARRAFGSYTLLDQADRIASESRIGEAFDRFLAEGKPVLFVVSDDKDAWHVFPAGYNYEPLPEHAGWMEDIWVFRVTRP